MIKKKNKFLKFLIFFIILIGILFFANKQFDLSSKIKDIFGVGDIKNNDEKPKEEEPIVIPKLKIVDEDSDSRVVAIMVNNHKLARPHSGIQDAFLNYEIIVESGITRFLCLFKDKDTQRIGSIRSARHYFLDYVLENDAIYVHFGQSPEALTDIKSLGINALNGLYSSSLYWRDKTLNKPTEHTAFSSMERINNLIKEKGYRSTSNQDMLLNYTTDEVDLFNLLSSQKADKVYIEYSSYTNTSYEYDKETKLYKRFMSGVAHTDYVTKEQYTTKNIITYQVKNTTTGSKGRQSIDNVGSGTGYYITNGYAIPITWEKTSRNSQTIYKYQSGEEININDGVTWIQIQPIGKTLKLEGISENSSTN